MDGKTRGVRRIRKCDHMVSYDVYVRSNDEVGSHVAFLSVTQMEFMEKMAENGRFATFGENGKVFMLMLFSVTNDPEPYLNNIDHEYMEHDPYGKVLVIEDMICGKFKFKYVDLIQDTFCKRFPNIEKAMWRRRRFPKDKIYTLWRRHQCLISK